MPLHRMTALFSLAFLGCQAAFAATAPGIDLGAWRMETSSSPALPASGTLILEPATLASHQTAIEAASGAMNPLRGGSQLRKLLADREMKIELDTDARTWLANAGYDPVYGARPLKRVIQKELQNPLANEILAGKIKDGETIQVTAGKDGLTIKARRAKAA